MLKQNTVFTAPAKDVRKFFAKKNLSRQLKNAQRQHEANAAAYADRKEQRRILARTLDPIPFLQGSGLVIEQKNKHFNIFRSGDRHEIARLTYNEDAGCWLACGREREPLGDMIALARHLYGYSYLDAVDALLQAHGISDKRYPAQPTTLKALCAATVVEYARKPKAFPVLPEQTDADVAAGHAYLLGRHIDPDVLTKAETCGNLRYGQVNNRHSVLFVGIDIFSDDRVMSATHRSVTSDFKGDITDSDKAFPCILIGDTTDDIEVVEGGVSGLSAQTRAKREGRPVPTIIVTGGATVLKFLENALVRELLTAADLEAITVWFENETLSAKAIARDAADTKEATCLALLDKKQAESDAAHEKQIAGIESLGGPVLVTRARPVALRHKDVADVLRAEVTQPAAGNIAGLVEIQAAQNRDCPPGRA